MNYHEAAEELIRTQMIYSKQLCKIADIISSRGEDLALLVLHNRNDSVYAGEFTTALGLTTGRVANLLKQMERKGDITRVPDTEDRRKTRISLTETGVRRAHEAYDRMLKDYVWLLEGLGEQDSQQLIRVLKQGAELLHQHETLFEK